MNLFDVYKTCYKKAIENANSIESPYEKAIVYTNIMNAIALMSRNSDAKDMSDTESDETSTATKKTKKKAAEATPVEVPSVDINQNDAPTASEPVTEAATDTPSESIIDKTSDEDPDEWTDEVTAKYANEINYIQEQTAIYGQEVMDDFVKSNTDGVYKSFGEMGPREFIATYQLVKTAIEQAG